MEGGVGGGGGWGGGGGGGGGGANRHPTGLSKCVSRAQMGASSNCCTNDDCDGEPEESGNIVVSSKARGPMARRQERQHPFTDTFEAWDQKGIHVQEADAVAQAKLVQVLVAKRVEHGPPPPARGADTGGVTPPLPPMLQRPALLREGLVSPQGTVQQVVSTPMVPFRVAVTRKFVDQSVGLLLGAVEGGLSVLSIMPGGLFEEWNQKNPQLQVVAGSLLVELNGSVRDPAPMLQAAMGALHLDMVFIPPCLVPQRQALPQHPDIACPAWGTPGYGGMAMISSPQGS
eukprot:NODE_9923_length_1390_cov_5.383215.p1 GENE.NODE_9923_length_1390_cov_5.383215~~NODE_9923_length_1390_cov_5.383215.p1  ORF type:complete len:287 (-),score=36.49 NODE_9923_length_1390_cov_5.383215:416-1276(-)